MWSKQIETNSGTTKIAVNVIVIVVRTSDIATQSGCLASQLHVRSAQCADRSRPVHTHNRLLSPISTTKHFKTSFEGNVMQQVMDGGGGGGGAESAKHRSAAITLITTVQ
jgi:hypothetical protein